MMLSKGSPLGIGLNAADYYNQQANAQRQFIANQQANLALANQQLANAQMNYRPVTGSKMVPTHVCTYCGSRGNGKRCDSCGAPA